MPSIAPRSIATEAEHGLKAPGAMAATLVPASWGELLRQRTRWTTGHMQCCALHAVRARGATWHFRLLVFPNFVLATFLAPAGLLALLALAVEGGGRVLPLDAWGATVVSTVLVYVQRAIGVWAAPRPARPRLHHFLLEPAFSSGVATLAFACAARDLMAGAMQRVRRRRRAEGGAPA
jgi:hypothetical protein